MRSVSSSPCSLRMRVDRVDEVVDAALELELGVEAGVERHRERPSSASAQPSGAARSTKTSSGEARALDPDAPSASRSKRPSASAAPDRPAARRRASGPAASGSAWRGRLRRPSARRRPTSPEARRRSPPHARPPARRPRRRAPERLAELDAARRGAPGAELDDTARLGHLADSASRPALRPPASRPGRRSPARPRRAGDQHLPEMLGQERHHRRDPADPARARTRACGTPPGRTLPRSAGANGGCTSWRGRRRRPRSSRSPGRELPRAPRSTSARYACVRAMSQRSSGRASRPSAPLEIGVARLEPLDVAVGRRGTRRSSRA